MTGHDTGGPRLILLWQILVMMMSASKMHVKTSTKFKSMKVNKQSFFEALLHRYSDPSMFLIKGMEALKKTATEHLYEESKGCTDEFTTLRAVL